MGRISKMKRQMIMEANKRLLTQDTKNEVIKESKENDSDKDDSNKSETK
jgi:hypothetical protein